MDMKHIGNPVVLSFFLRRCRDFTDTLEAHNSKMVRKMVKIFMWVQLD